MNVALLLITHDKIASGMIEITSSIINYQPENIACVEIPMDSSVDEMEKKVTNKLEHLNTQDGVLILTDMYGGTPSNIANKFAAEENTMLVSGLNLPMLIKLMNYRTLSLKELTQKAIEGAQDGVATYERGVV